MTTPINDVMPYGITLIPIDAWGGWMTVDDSAGSKKRSESQINVPSTLFTIQVTSTMVGDTTMQIYYLDGSPATVQTIFSGGGRYATTLSGVNILYIRIGNNRMPENYAAGRRCAAQFIPIPNPV